MKKILGSVRVDPDGGYSVASGEIADTIYNVYKSIHKGYRCTCPYYAIKQGECIHILTIKTYERIKGIGNYSNITNAER